MVCCRLSILYLLYHTSTTGDLYLPYLYCFLFGGGDWQIFFILFFDLHTFWNNFRFRPSFACTQKLSNDLAFQCFYLIYDIVLYWYLNTKWCDTCFLIVKVVFIYAHVLFCKYWYKCTCILSLEKTLRMIHDYYSNHTGHWGI